MVAFLVTLVSLMVLSVPYAIALAMLLAVFDLIPLVGATIGSVIVILATLATTGTSEALVMLAVIVVYQQIENHLLQPLVYGRTVHVATGGHAVRCSAGPPCWGWWGRWLRSPSRERHRRW